MRDSENDVRSGRRRGRPRGRTAQGTEAKQRLYRVAIQLIATRGYETTTLRDVAREAGVSVGLLYRYFPSKRAVVLALYDELSAEYAERAALMRVGPWRDRFFDALQTSLEVLGPQRSTLAALVPVLVGDAREGLFAPGTQFSRMRVQKVFAEAVLGASDAPKPELAGPLGRLLYLVHLAVILWWLLDKSPAQRATHALVGSLQRALPITTLTLRFRAVQAFIQAADAAFREALLQDAPVVGLNEPDGS